MVEIHLFNPRIVLPHESTSIVPLRGYVQCDKETSDKYNVSLLGKATLEGRQQVTVYQDTHEVSEWMRCGARDYRAYFVFEIPADLPPTLLPLASRSEIKAQIEYNVIASTLQHAEKSVKSVKLIRSCAYPRPKVCWGMTKSSAWKYEVEAPSTITVSGSYSVFVRVQSRSIQLKPESSCFISCQVIETLSTSRATSQVLLDTNHFLAAPSQSWTSPVQIAMTLDDIRPSVSSQLFDIRHSLLLKLEFAHPSSGHIMDKIIFSMPLTVLGSKTVCERDKTSPCPSKDSDSDSGVWLSS